MGKYKRGGGKKKKKRGNIPPVRCFVCEDPIKEMIALKSTTSPSILLLKNAAEKVVKLCNGENVPIYRHSDCEPGSFRYMQNPVLRKSYLKTLNGE